MMEKICESVEIPVLTRCCFCFPLRKGLISFAYINLVLTLVVASFLSLYMAQLRSSTSTAPTEAYQAPDASHGAASPPEVNLHSDAVEASEAAEFPRLVADTVGLLLELVMTVSFIVALHKKHVLLMKVYLYFEIVFSVIGFAYSLAFMTRETASELFLILFQLTIQIYLVILIWSSIVKMERDGSVKYVRDREGV